MKVNGLWCPLRAWILPSAIALAGLFSSVAMAATPTPAGKWYQVEVLIFEQPPHPPVEETMPLVTGLPAMQHAVDLQPFQPEIAGDNFIILPESEWKLMELHKKVSRVLLHVRWRQWLTGQSTAIPVHLYGGPAYGDPAELSLYPYPWALEGTLTLWMSRYLHVEADLVYQQKDAKDHLHPYRLTETRRLRSNELHYLDHPSFGMLIQLTPEKATPTPVEAPPSTSDVSAEATETPDAE